MKFHEILGIRENATLNEIEAAYTKKKRLLSTNKHLMCLSSYQKKYEELEMAYQQSIEWLVLSPQERIKEKSDSIEKPHTEIRLYSSAIGICTLCTTNCYDEEEKETCPYCCEPLDCCAYTFDGAIILAVIAGVVYFAVQIVRAIIDQKDESDKQKRIAKYDSAVASNMRLQEELVRINDQIRDAQTERERLESILIESLAFSTLFESMGTISFQNVLNKQKLILDEYEKKIAKLNIEKKDLQDKIDANSKIIHSGRR